MLDIARIIQEAVGKVIANDNQGLYKGHIHHHRSSAFVENIADALRSYYIKNTDVRVFSRGNSSNQVDFRINELLFDITVCSTAKTLLPPKKLAQRARRRSSWGQPGQ